MSPRSRTRTLACAAATWPLLIELAILVALACPCQAGDHRPPAAVPPSLEIEVLDPNADPLGNPAVEPIPGPDGRSAVDIPRLVLVHRYYYSGDRSFQFRLLPGGPCTIVANHPKTGERQYLEATLPPGAPRVTYTASSIEYRYGSQAVVVHFVHHGKAKLSYIQGHDPTKRGFGLSLEKEERPAGPPRPTLAERCKSVGNAAKKATHAAGDGIKAVGKAVTRPIASAIRATPLGGQGVNAVEAAAIRERNTLQDAASKEIRLDNATIPAFPQ